MNKKSYAVIGLGFGDEGKGRTCDYICSISDNPIVIRYSGGQQAAHHVMSESGVDHVFSNFGSGSLREVPTFWSSFCTFDPEGLMNESLILRDKGISPCIYVDAKCPVTTPFEKIVNMKSRKKIEDGTVGVGVGVTWEREEKLQSLLVEDLLNPTVLKIKMDLLEEFYNLKVNLKSFYDAVEDMKDLIEIIYDYSSLMSVYNSYIFEGSQGLLLDESYGFYPHVTRSSVGLKNIKSLNPLDSINVLYVTRAYQTRHGNGPMTNQHWPVKANKYEQICPGPQGEFRTSILDLDLLLYGIRKDGKYFNPEFDSKSLVVTCLDVLGEYRLTHNKKLYCFQDKKEFLKFISKILGPFDKMYFSESPFTKDMIQLNG